MPRVNVVRVWGEGTFQPGLHHTRRRWKGLWAALVSLGCFLTAWCVLRWFGGGWEADLHGSLPQRCRLGRAVGLSIGVRDTDGSTGVTGCKHFTSRRGCIWVQAVSLPGGDCFFPSPMSVLFSFLIFGYRSTREFSKPLVRITPADLLPVSESLPMD